MNVEDARRVLELTEEIERMEESINAMIGQASKLRAERSRIVSGVEFFAPTPIEKALETGPMSISEIVKATGRSRNSVNSHLSQLRQSGRVRRVDRGRYSL